MDLIFLYRPDAYLAAIVTTMFLAGLFLLVVNKRNQAVEQNEGGTTADRMKSSRFRPTIDL